MAQVKGNGAVADTASLDLDRADSVNDDGEDTVIDAVGADQIDDLFKDLKTLLNTVEKLQKARQDVGDIKPLIVRLLDGELISGDDLEELRGGISGLSKLLKLYSDYQGALERAQPARAILDQLLKS
ncbi:hypothetical protein VB780_17745 [Leptolyngbya sp. CCNP1308]|uniref:hypothetical protein n=1 Tax=Leptolyngbya sp. CCNP1308 TaxID=3110255 RepID=UPI002B1EE54F|nr:hypothetical protein [Leptolyngbya sp. CCNP1308]MEA5450429.1 hypothetical protein [Leptolyngbya sp. CCNP1308]